jgi:predicted ArsR family transcriptional regulator
LFFPSKQSQEFIMATNARILKSLQNGAELTKAQITQRFGVRNPSAHISRLRQAGYSIYNNTRSTRGGTKNVYRLGTPTRKTVAAGNVVLSDPLYRNLLADRIANIRNPRTR